MRMSRELQSISRTYRVCRPSVTQVSSVHSIRFHCNRVQYRCSCAQASRRSLFFSEIGDLCLANLLKIPSRLIARRSTVSDTCNSKVLMTSSHGIRRVRFELVMKSAIRLRDGVLSKALGPQRCFCGVGLVFFAYRICLSVTNRSIVRKLLTMSS